MIDRVMTKINTNVAALMARSYVQSSANKQRTSMERLSSGVRVNSASNDADWHGLGVANKIKSDPG